MNDWSVRKFIVVGILVTVGIWLVALVPAFLSRGGFRTKGSGLSALRGICSVPGLPFLTASASSP